MSYLRSEVATAIARHRDDQDEHRVVPVWIDGKPSTKYDIYGLNLLHGIVLEDPGAIGSTAGRLHALVGRRSVQPAAASLRVEGLAPPAELITNFRLPRNPHFTGRDELLDELARAAESSQVATTQSVVGVGGVGKSELAARRRQQPRRQQDGGRRHPGGALARLSVRAQGVT